MKNPEEIKNVSEIQSFIQTLNLLKDEMSEIYRKHIKTIIPNLQDLHNTGRWNNLHLCKYVGCESMQFAIGIEDHRGVLLHTCIDLSDREERHHLDVEFKHNIDCDFNERNYIVVNPFTIYSYDDDMIKSGLELLMEELHLKLTNSEYEYGDCMLNIPCDIECLETEFIQVLDELNELVKDEKFNPENVYFVSRDGKLDLLE